MSDQIIHITWIYVVVTYTVILRFYKTYNLINKNYSLNNLDFLKF